MRLDFLDNKVDGYSWVRKRKSEKPLRPKFKVAEAVTSYFVSLSVCRSKRQEGEDLFGFVLRHRFSKCHNTATASRKHFTIHLLCLCVWLCVHEFLCIPVYMCVLQGLKPRRCNTIKVFVFLFVCVYVEALSVSDFCLVHQLNGGVSTGVPQHGFALLGTQTEEWDLLNPASLQEKQREKCEKRMKPSLWSHNQLWKRNMQMSQKTETQTAEFSVLTSGGFTWCHIFHWPLRGDVLKSISVEVVGAKSTVVDLRSINLLNHIDIFLRYIRQCSNLF